MITIHHFRHKKHKTVYTCRCCFSSTWC